MKFFPKTAKTKKFSKKPRSAWVKPVVDAPSENQNAVFDFRKEFDLLASTMYKRLTPENTKKLWLVTSSIIFKNIGSSQDLRHQLKVAIEQAHKILFK